MKPGRFSDNEAVTLLDGRKGMILRSCGHFAMDPNHPRRPDETRGPRYKVLLDGRGLTPAMLSMTPAEESAEAAGAVILVTDEDIE
jgi:hypothetical protein